MDNEQLLYHAVLAAGVAFVGLEIGAGFDKERAGLGALAALVFAIVYFRNAAGSGARSGEEAGESRSAAECLEEAIDRADVVIEEVTPKSAKSVHAELRRGKTFQRLADSRLQSQFVFDFFSCVAGKWLPGSSTLGADQPGPAEYRPGGNFYWSGIRIYCMRQASTGSICGLYVFHDAYLSSYPGPDEHHHRVNPRISRRGKRGRDISSQIGGSRHDGSARWCDIPILAGPGYGRLLLSHCLQTASAAGKKDFMVSVAGGVENEKMVALLAQFGFSILSMTHPKTGEAWLDEAGEPLYLLCRSGNISSRSATALLLTPPGSR